MEWVTVFKCPRCSVELPYAEAFLSGSDLVATCPKCQNAVVIKNNVQCDKCRSPADHVRMVQDFASESWGYNQESFCHKHFPYYDEILRNGTLVRKCKDCDAEWAVKSGVTCEKCGEPAAHIKGSWLVNTPDRYFCPAHFLEFEQEAAESERVEAAGGCSFCLVGLILLVLIWWKPLGHFPVGTKVLFSLGAAVVAVLVAVAAAEIAERK